MMRTRSAARRATLTSAFEALPAELLERCFGHLDARSLLAAASVSRAWRAAGASDVPWRRLCKRLWASKAYVPRRFAEAADAAGARARYFASVADATRVEISRAELCELGFFFRFKLTAGSQWTDSDPYWQGEPALAMRFQSDGSVLRSGTVLHGFHWRFVEPPPAGGLLPRADESDSARAGTAICLEHPEYGRFPSELVVRQSDWGFTLNSAWVVYSTTPMALATTHARGPLSDRQLHRMVKGYQWVEAEAYNQALSWASESESSDDEADAPL